MNNNLSTIKQNVEFLLINYPQTRENDSLLIRYYAKHFCGFDIPQIETLPISTETITRCRRKLQSENIKYRPLDKAVIFGRAKKEEEYREAFGNKTA